MGSKRVVGIFFLGGRHDFLGRAGMWFCSQFFSMFLFIPTLFFLGRSEMLKSGEWRFSIWFCLFIACRNISVGGGLDLGARKGDTRAETKSLDICFHSGSPSDSQLIIPEIKKNKLGWQVLNVITILLIHHDHWNGETVGNYASQL